MTREQIVLDTPAMSQQDSGLVQSAVSCARWIRAAAGGSTASVRIAVLDPAKRLRVIASEGSAGGSGPRRSTRRRTVFRTQEPVVLSVREENRASVGIFPMTHAGTALGVVEVLGPAPLLQQRVDVLEALVGQSALVLAGARAQVDAERALEGKSALVQMASELVWATTPVDVLRKTVKACHEHLGVPVAALFPDRDGWGWFLAASGGMGTRARETLRARLQAAGGTSGQLVGEHALQAYFEQAVGCRDVTSLRPDAAVVLIGNVPGGQGDFLRGLRSLVAETLPAVRVNGGRTPRASGDLEIAWTAHELRGPLLGARAALDVVSEEPMRSDGQALLSRTRQELEQLSDLIDPLLRWSTGNEMLERRPVDLLEVVREAVASACLGGPTERVDMKRMDMTGEDRPVVLADPRQLRSAIANVVRNAITYSPVDVPVKVDVQSNRRSARVVVQDQGEGIPPEEGERVFEPFSRGTSSEAKHRGTGLGLFIARRVLEAHGGSIALRRPGKGATFVLEIPTEEWEQSAS